MATSRLHCTLNGVLLAAHCNTISDHMKHVRGRVLNVFNNVSRLPDSLRLIRNVCSGLPASRQRRPLGANTLITTARSIVSA